MSSYSHLPPYSVAFPAMAFSQEDGVDWGVAAYGIPELWKQYRGEGVTVAVVDSGIAKHPAIEVREWRNFSADASEFDSLGHGCIAPHDEVYTSACGVQMISTLFDRVDGVQHELPDQSVIKDVSRLGIHTLGYDPDTQQTVRRKVLAVHKLTHSGRVIKVRTREGELTFTPWHPVYVQTSQRGADRSTKRIRADELQAGDRLVTSRRNDGVYGDTHLIHLEPRWICRWCGYVARRGNRTHCKSCDKCRWHEGPVQRSLPLNGDLAFFLGLVASDGHVMKSGTTISFHNRDRRLADVFDELCVKLFNRHAKERKPDPRSPGVIEQRLHSVDAWSICRKQMGMQSNKSRSIEFPELIAKSSPDVILSFLAGVIEGDGSICKRTGRIRVATGSEKFARRMVSVCRFLGMYASMAKVQPSRTGFKTPDHSWCVRICNDNRLASKLRVKKVPLPVRCVDRRALTVTDISVEPYQGFMYDLTVEGSHNYAANGVIVSNTHVAGVIAARKGPCRGIAPGASLISCKALGHSGTGSNTAVAEAVEYATEAKADIIGMSLGSESPDPRLHAAIKSAHEAGVIVVCAAGNDGGSVNYPAAFAETIAVGAVDRHGNACPFSCRGKEIAIAAPGQDITSTWLNEGYATLTGTSMAAPFVVGTLALYVSSLKKRGEPVNHQAVLKALSQTAKDAGEAGKDDIYGWGLVNPGGLLNYTTMAGVTIYIPGARVV